VDPFALLASPLGALHLGEPITQLEHALQAAHFARAAGADDDLVLAALLHDVGNLLGEIGPLGTPDHEEVGAKYLLEHGFSARIAELVRGHVPAKRYLAAREAWSARLSDASKTTLVEQGGAMTAEEAAAFERDPLFADKLRLRRFDEAAKRPGFIVAGLDTYCRAPTR
jgi:predicted HD phosphohydrolase